MTKIEAEFYHRLVWSYISRETKKRKYCISKEQAFEELQLDYVYSHCFACAYNNYNCCNCLVVWPYNRNQDIRPQCVASLYGEWVACKKSGLWRYASRLAEEIANLPLREGV